METFSIEHVQRSCYLTFFNILGNLESHRMFPSLTTLPNFDPSLTGLLAVSFFPFSTSKHFQSLIVSSAAALATVVSSGDIVKHSTLAVWPVQVIRCLDMDPYFKIHKLKCNCKNINFIYWEVLWMLFHDFQIQQLKQQKWSVELMSAMARFPHKKNVSN